MVGYKNPILEALPKKKKKKKTAFASLFLVSLPFVRFGPLLTKYSKLSLAGGGK